MPAFRDSCELRRPDAAHLQDDGHLLLAAGGRIYRVAPWRRGAAWHVRRNGRWEIQFRDPGIALMPRHGHVHDAVGQYLAPVPQPVREFLAPFKRDQATLFRLLSCFDSARDLALSSPALLWLVARYFGLYRAGTPAAGFLLCRRQHQVIRELTGDPGTGRARARFLRKIRLWKRDDEEMNAILDALRNEEMVHATRHWQVLYGFLLRRLEAFPCLLSNRVLYRHIHAHDPRDDGGALESWLLSHDLACIIGQGTEQYPRWWIEQRLNRCRTPEDVRDLYDHLYWRRRFHGRAALLPPVEEHHTPYPPSLVDGNGYIVPIRNFRELEQESKSMGHCALEYHAVLVRGGVTIYRVLAPHRGTLLLSLDGRRPRIGQFRLARNRHPPRESWEAVWRWLRLAMARPEEEDVC